MDAPLVRVKHRADSEHRCYIELHCPKACPSVHGAKPSSVARQPSVAKERRSFSIDRVVCTFLQQAAVLLQQAVCVDLAHGHTLSLLASPLTFNDVDLPAYFASHAAPALCIFLIQT
jgi:hypothetical protein